MNARDILVLIVGALIIVALGLLVAAWPAGGQESSASRCLPISTAFALVLERYGERPQYAGATTTGDIVTMTVNSMTGSWTAWVTPREQADAACVAATGSEWHSLGSTP